MLRSVLLFIVSEDVATCYDLFFVLHTIIVTVEY
jgi:hypothetical protein